MLSIKGSLVHLHKDVSFVAFIFFWCITLGIGQEPPICTTDTIILQSSQDSLTVTFTDYVIDPDGTASFIFGYDELDFPIENNMTYPCDTSFNVFIEFEDNEGLTVFCQFHLQLTCLQSDDSEFYKVFTSENIDLVRDIYCSESSIYITGIKSGILDSGFIQKLDLSGNLIWNITLEDSIYINDIKVADDGKVYFVGQTPFSFNDSYSVAGCVQDLGLTYNLLWYKKYDSFYTFSNGTVVNIGDRFFNVLFDNNNLVVHGTAAIRNTLPQESTMATIIDENNGDVIENRRYYFSNDFSGYKDPHLWREFKQNETGGYTFYGQNNADGNDAMFVYIDPVLDTSYTVLVSQIGFFQDGFDLGNGNQLLVGDNFIGIIDINANGIASHDITGIQGIFKLFGPFDDPNSANKIYYGSARNTVNSKVTDVIIAFTVVDNNIILLWSKRIQFPDYEEDNIIGKFFINSFDQFIYTDSKIDTSNQANNQNIIVASFNSESCYLEDYSVSLQNKFMTPRVDLFVETTYQFPDVMNLTFNSSEIYSCNQFGPCPSFYDSCSVNFTWLVNNCNQVSFDGVISGFEDPTLVTYEWFSSDDPFSSSSQDAFYIFEGDQTQYEVCLIAADGLCSDTFCDMISVTIPGPPEFENCTDQDIIIEECSISLDFSTITAVDLCTFEFLPINCDRSDGLEMEQPYSLGTTTVTCSAASPSGFVNLCQFNVELIDNEPPIISNCTEAVIELDENGVAEFNITDISISATDNCELAGTTLSNKEFNCDDNITDYTVFVEDMAGNLDSCSNLIFIEDNIAPTIANCDPLVVELDENGQTSYSSGDISFIATDNCGIGSTTVVNPNLNCNIEETTYELIVNDNANNSSTCSNTVFVQDLIQPSCTNSDIFISNPNFLDSIPIEFMIIAMDNCGVNIISSNVENGDMYPCGSIINVETILIDNYGNSGDCDFIITLGECPNTECDISLVIDIDECGSLDAMANIFEFEQVPTYTWFIDNVQVSVSEVNELSTIIMSGEYEICCDVSDGECNASVCQFISVADSPIEFESCTPFTLVGNCNYIFNQDDVLAVNICDGSPTEIICVRMDGESIDEALALGQNIIICTATNQTESEECLLDITVFDNTRPTCRVVQNYSVDLDEDGMAQVEISDLDDGSFDNCGEVTIIDAGPISVNCSEGYTATINYEIVDQANRMSTCTVEVQLIDKIPPFCIVNDITIELDANGETTLSSVDIDNGSTDNCIGFEFPLFESKYSCDDLGEIQENVTIIDESGNETICSYSVHLVDNQSPDCILGEKIIELNENGLATLPQTVYDNEITDNCTVVGIEIERITFTCADFGIQTIEINVTDQSGNTNICFGVIEVLDQIKPECVAEDIEVVADMEGGSIVVYDILATDNCEISTIDYSIPSGSFIECGEYSVNVIVQDQSYNSAECSFKLEVVDCDACCKSEEIFINTTNQEFELISSLEFDQCKIILNAPNLLSGCQYTTALDWGDGTSSEFMISSSIPLEHLYALPGEYNICVTYSELSSLGELCFENTLCDSIIIFEDCTFRRKNLQEQLELIIYPNPTAGTLNIDFVDSAGSHIIEIHLFSLKGEILYSKENINENYLKLDLSNLNDGIYLLKIFDSAGGSDIKKIIVL